MNQKNETFELPPCSRLAFSNNSILLKLLKTIEEADSNSPLKKTWGSSVDYFKSSMKYMALFTPYTDIPLNKLIINFDMSLTLLIRAEQFRRTVESFIQEHKDTQILFLGAGMDTFFLNKFEDYYNKTNLTTVSIFMFDYPIVNELKMSYLAKANIYMPEFCQNVDGDIKLNLAELLKQNNISPHKNTLIVASGLSMYLTEEELKTAYDAINNYISPTYKVDIIMDYLHPQVITTEGARDIDKNYNSTDCTSFDNMMKEKKSPLALLLQKSLSAYSLTR